MRKAIVLIHGYGNTPKDHWFAWLHQQLEEKGCTVVAPQMPHPKAPQLQEWMHYFEDTVVPHMDKETMIVGHSLGVPFLLSALERYTLKAAFCVAGFASLLESDFDQYNRSFVDRDFHWDAIRDHCQQFRIYHAEDDPYVPYTKAEELSAELGTSVVTVPGAGHFNTDSGYVTFPQLLEDILAT